MKYTVRVFCPDTPEMINKITGAMSAAGAGIIGNYSGCFFVAKGESRWKSEEGAHPAIGKVGEVSFVKEAKIETICPADKAKIVEAAIRKVHPYEEPVIEFIKLEE